MASADDKLACSHSLIHGNPSHKQIDQPIEQDDGERESTSRRHGEQPRDVSCLVKFVDKTVRLRLLPIKGKDHFEDGLITWFGIREEQTHA